MVLPKIDGKNSMDLKVLLSQGYLQREIQFLPVQDFIKG